MHGEQANRWKLRCGSAYFVKYLRILDRFSQSFHHMRERWVQMMDLYLIFRFNKGLCHGYYER